VNYNASQVSALVFDIVSDLNNSVGLEVEIQHGVVEGSPAVVFALNDQVSQLFS
jgi:hypothetical protein